MTLLPEVIEECALDHIPIAVAHCPDQRLRAKALQAHFVAGVLLSHARIVFELGWYVLTQHAAFVCSGRLDLHRQIAIDERHLDELVAYAAGVRATHNPRERAAIFLR